jgi:hypothetical protein
MQISLKTTNVSLLLLFCLLQTLFAGVKSNGIGIRGMYWGTKDQTTQIRIVNSYNHHEVTTNGFGGNLYFFTKLDGQYFIEFTIGAVGNVEAKHIYFDREEVYVNSATVMLFGFRYDLFNPAKIITAQPYLSAGFGPYWLGEIEVKNNNFWGGEEATVRTRVKPGVYAGFGTHFLFCDWCGLNLDIKYHLVNFDMNMPYSDFAFGMGFMFTWK